jgi:hypothetical protein
MEPKVINWDGAHLPDELRKLPPGRYAVEPVDPSPLTEQEESGIITGLDELDSGQGITLGEVVREIRNRPLKR